MDIYFYVISREFENKVIYVYVLDDIVFTKMVNYVLEVVNSLFTKYTIYDWITCECSNDTKTYKTHLRSIKEK